MRNLAWLALALLFINLAAGAGLLGLGLAGGVACAGLGAVAWLLGLRHAFDADHIAAIDNVTRSLRQQGHRPVAVGFFFSLGHSTVVMLVTLALAVGLARADGFAGWLSEWGVPVSLFASAAFLTLVGALNLRSLRELGQRAASDPPRARFAGVTHSRSMFPLGLLFGLNLDTAGEIVLLGAAAAALAADLPLWAMMAFPLLFTAGMAAADSAEGLLMLRLYDWALTDRDRTWRLNTATTTLSAALALGIAACQWLALARWGGVSLADLGPGFGASSAMLGFGATVLMTMLWIAARLRRPASVVARVS